MSATYAPTDTPADPADLPQEPPRRRWRRLALVLLAVAVVAVAAWWSLLRTEPPPGEIVEGEIVTLEPLTTTTGRDGLHHARIGIAIVLTEDGDPAVIEEQTPLIQDVLLREIAERDADTLRSAEGSEQLRTDLTEAARSIWSAEDVSRVVLVELLVQ